MIHGGSNDTGDADPRLAAALAAGDLAGVHAALVTARVFAAITATATAEHTAATGLRAESSAEMAVVLLQAPDGSRALPVFPDIAALKRWRLDARPVPLTGPQACAAALEEGAADLLVDPAGAAVVVSGLASMGAGWVPVPGSSLAARRGDAAPIELATAVAPDLAEALREALQGEPLSSARVWRGPDGPVLGVVGPRELAPEELAALAQRLVVRLGDALPADGLDLAQVALHGPGQDVLRRRRFRRGR